MVSQGITYIICFYAYKTIICPFMKHMLILTANVAVTHGPYGLLYFEIKQMMYNI